MEIRHEKNRDNSSVHYKTKLIRFVNLYTMFTPSRSLKEQIPEEILRLYFNLKSYKSAMDSKIYYNTLFIRIKATFSIFFTRSRILFTWLILLSEFPQADSFFS